MGNIIIILLTLIAFWAFLLLEDLGVFLVPETWAKVLIKIAGSALLLVALICIPNEGKLPTNALPRHIPIFIAFWFYARTLKVLPLDYRQRELKRAPWVLGIAVIMHIVLLVGLMATQLIADFQGNIATAIYAKQWVGLIAENLVFFMFVSYPYVRFIFAQTKENRELEAPVL